MWNSFFIIFMTCALCSRIEASEQMVQESVKLDDKIEPVKTKPGKSPEDSIPVIEIRGEGKPMTAAQIRALEEEEQGKPLDIKVKKTWTPGNCPRSAKRKDFITFQYKLFLEDGKKIDQTYGRGPIRIQLGVGMTMPGLDKGMKAMCDTELRKIQIPWRLSRKKKSKIWKYVPNEEHWLTFDIEMLKVEQWSAELQFDFMDLNNDSYLTINELQKYSEKMRRDFGKTLPNEDIDIIHLTKHYVRYFDRNGDEKVSRQELVAGMNADLYKSKGKSTKEQRQDPKNRTRDPGLGWVLDFNNDGIVSYQELEMAPDLLEQGWDAIEEYLGVVGNKRTDPTKDKQEL